MSPHHHISVDDHLETEDSLRKVIEPNAHKWLPEHKYETLLTNDEQSIDRTKCGEE